MRHENQGFTLIELLVVIAVLGILAAVVLVAVDPSTRLKEARDSGVKSDVGQLAQAIETYYTSNNGTYPTALSDLVTDGHLKVVPSPPSGRGVDCTGAAGGSAGYQYSTSGGEAVVYCALENPDTAGDVYCYRTATRSAAELAPASCTP